MRPLSAIPSSAPSCFRSPAAEASAASRNFKTPSGRPSYTNLSLYKKLAPLVRGSRDASTITWHFAHEDAEATATWLRSPPLVALLEDAEALKRSAALISLQQCVLAVHAANNA